MDKPKAHSGSPELKKSLEGAGVKEFGKVKADESGKLDNITAGFARKQATETAKKAHGATNAVVKNVKNAVLN